MVRDRVFYDLEQLDGGVRRLDGELVKQLHHQPGEAGKRPRDAGLGIDLDQHIVGSVNENLKKRKRTDFCSKPCGVKTGVSYRIV